MKIKIVKKRENPFVQIDKKAINDKRLSWKAKGILAYLLSKPDGWRINTEDLYNRSIDGYDSLKNGMKELILAGYMETVSVFKENSSEFLGRETRLYEIPLFKEGFRDPKNRNREFSKDEVLLQESPTARKHNVASKGNPNVG